MIIPVSTHVDFFYHQMTQPIWKKLHAFSTPISEAMWHHSHHGLFNVSDKPSKTQAERTYILPLIHRFYLWIRRCTRSYCRKLWWWVLLWAESFMVWFSDFFNILSLSNMFIFWHISSYLIIYHIFLYRKSEAM